MKMRRIGENGTLARLDAFYLKRVQALVNVLQQKLDHLSPQPISAGDRVVLNVSPGDVVGDFTVEAVPSSDPAKSMAYVRDELGNEVLVDTVVAASYLDRLGLGVSRDQVWENLNAAATESVAETITAPGGQDTTLQDAEAEALWQQQLQAYRRLSHRKPLFHLDW